MGLATLSVCAHPFWAIDAFLTCVFNERSGLLELLLSRCVLQAWIFCGCFKRPQAHEGLTYDTPVSCLRLATASLIPACHFFSATAGAFRCCLLRTNLAHQDKTVHVPATFQCLRSSSGTQNKARKELLLRSCLLRHQNATAKASLLAPLRSLQEPSKFYGQHSKLQTKKFSGFRRLSVPRWF